VGIYASPDNWRTCVFCICNKLQKHFVFSECSQKYLTEQIQFSKVFCRFYYPNVTISYVRVFANANPSVLCLSVCRLSVTLVHPTQGVEAFGNISLLLCTLASSDLRTKFYGHRARETPSSGALNARPGIRIQRFWTCRRLYFINGTR